MLTIWWSLAVPATLFEDDFEGALDGQWLGSGSASITAAQVCNGGGAVTFGSQTSGRDLVSRDVVVQEGQVLHLRTAYLTTGGGGYLGLDTYTAGGAVVGEAWLLGDEGTPVTWRYRVGATDPAELGVWRYYEATWTVPAGVGRVRVKAEDFVNGLPNGQPVYFDDVVLSTEAVPDGVCAAGPFASDADDPVDTPETDGGDPTDTTDTVSTSPIRLGPIAVDPVEPEEDGGGCASVGGRGSWVAAGMALLLRRRPARRPPAWWLAVLVAPLFAAECAPPTVCEAGQYKYACTCTHGPPIPIPGTRIKTVNAVQCDTSKASALAAAAVYAHAKKGEDPWSCTCDGPEVYPEPATVETTDSPGCVTCAETIESGGDPEQLCAPAAAGFYDALVGCMCGAGPCAAACGGSACVSQTATNECNYCTQTTCSSEYNACLQH